MDNFEGPTKHEVEHWVSTSNSAQDEFYLRAIPGQIATLAQQYVASGCDMDTLYRALDSAK